jgi:hypothetical protein
LEPENVTAFCRRYFAYAALAFHNVAIPKRIEFAKDFPEIGVMVKKLENQS